MLPASFALARRRWSTGGWRRLGLATLVFDTAIVSAFVFAYSFQPGAPMREAVFTGVTAGRVDAYRAVAALAPPAVVAPPKQKLKRATRR